MSGAVARILELNSRKRIWEVPCISGEEVSRALKAHQVPEVEYLHFFTLTPYIDFMYVRTDKDKKPECMKRFTIHEGYTWDWESEEFFHEHCVNSHRCSYQGGDLDEIFEYYSKMHPEWHLQRYLSKGVRILDHIYHCLRQDTAKEMLYKSGLDELAVHIDTLDELNLLSQRPSDLYEGLSMKVLRSVNCTDGADLISKRSRRAFIKELNLKFPDIFKDQLNDAQCRYLKYLIDGDLTVGETGRLFTSRKVHLITIWCKSLFDLFMLKERQNHELLEACNELKRLDPIYADYIRDVKDFVNDTNIKQLAFYLVHNREKYDRLIRRSNRKREYDWMERGNGYFVRYPQTINDFCREAIYMSNCLLSFVEGMIQNDTTVLFMRKEDDVNKPFITIEIFKGELMQAYHRFNEDCSREEAEWIREYCRRHGISTGKFKFDVQVDELF